MAEHTFAPLPGPAGHHALRTGESARGHNSGATVRTTSGAGVEQAIPVTLMRPSSMPSTSGRPRRWHARLLGQGD